jgi:hypothetical protein
MDSLKTGRYEEFTVKMIQGYCEHSYIASVYLLYMGMSSQFFADVKIGLFRPDL